MSLKKIESLDIWYKDQVKKKRKEKVSLSEDEKAFLCEVKKEMKAKIEECKLKIESKTELYKKEDARIINYRKETSRKLGILNPKQLHDIKKKYNLNEYRKLFQTNIEKVKNCEELVNNYVKINHPEFEELKVEIENLKSYIREIRENVKQQHEHSWYIFGENKYQEITETIKNKHPYYLKVDRDQSGFYINAASGVYHLNRFCLKTKFLVSPLEEYITQFKNGEQVGIIQLYNNGLFYLYGNNVYKATRFYTDDQLLLLILDLEDKERRKFERLKHKFSLSENEVKKRREKVPENVRIAVWRRDEGKCTECGSRENIEYDHIIPVSKGGSSTERNIQILCEKCNREKSNKI